MNMLYDGDTFDHKDHTFLVRIARDAFPLAPWIEYDGHGTVSDWTTRSKRPGERVLSKDNRYVRYYDVQGTMSVALRDGWGAGPDVPGETRRQKAARAVEANFEYLRAWCNDEWEYVCVDVHLVDDEEEPIDGRTASLCGVESNCAEYIGEIAVQLADEILTSV